MMADTVRRPFAVSLAVLLYNLAAQLSLLFVLSFVLRFWHEGLLIGARIEDGKIGGPVLSGPALLLRYGTFPLLWSAAAAVLGYFLWQGRNWARLGLIVLVVWGVWNLGPQVLGGGAGPFSIGTLAIHLFFLVTLWGKKAREFCSR